MSKWNKPKSTAVTATGATVKTSDDWVDATTEFTQRTCIMDIIGAEGTGRTRLALTAPGPIALINADEKINGIVQPFVRKGKSIKVATFGLTATNDKQATLTAAEMVWAKVRGWMNDSRRWARTTVFDTATEGWEVCRLANFGELNPKGNRMDRLYGPVNAEFRSTFKAFRIAGVNNLITIHQVKDHYIDKIVNGEQKSINTGTTKRAGFKEFGYIADVVIRTGKRLERGETVFTATIEKGWMNTQLEGVTLEGNDIRFPYILSLITETEESEWA